MSDQNEQMQLLKQENEHLHISVEQLQKENSSLKKLRVKESNQSESFKDGTTVYQAHFIFPHTIQLLDPRNTVAHKLCGKRISAITFSLGRSRRIQLCSFVVNLLGTVCYMVSLTGLYPEIGWGSVGALSSAILYSSTLNVQVLSQLCQSFTFVSLLLLHTFYSAVLIDAVNLDPSRVFAIVVYYVGMFSAFSFDARLFAKKPSRFQYLVYLPTFIAQVILLILWWTGEWQNINQRVLHVQNIQIDLMSIAMSVLFTITALVGKFSFSIYFSKELNPMIIIRPDVSFRPLVWQQQQLSSDV